MSSLLGDGFARLLAERVDQVIAALEAPTPSNIEALAAYAEEAAALDPDLMRAAMGRAFAAELRERAVLARRLAC
jgi:hypothetical protein